MGIAFRKAVKAAGDRPVTEGSPRLPPVRLRLLGRLRLLSPGVRARARREVQAGDDARGHDWRAAAFHYAAGLKLDPRLPHIWVQFGHALKESHDPASAEAAYRAALVHQSDVADTYLNLGHALKLQGLRQAAAGAYMRALELEGGWAEATRELSGLVRDGETLDLGALAAALESAPEVRPPLILHLSGLVRRMVAGALDAADKSRAALALDLLAAAPDLALCEVSARAAGLRLLPNALMADALGLALLDRPDPERAADIRRLLDLASGAGAACAAADGAVLVDFADEADGEDYRLQVRALGEVARIYAVTWPASPDAEVGDAPAFLVETAYERERLLQAAARRGRPLDRACVHVLDEQPGTARAERLLALASRLSAQIPPQATTEPASFDLYHGLGREPREAGEGPGLGERFREGDGWWRPEPWGSWTRPGGARLCVPVADAAAVVRLFVGLRAPPAQDCAYRLRLHGEPAAGGVLAAGEVSWRAIEARPRAGVLRIEIVGEGEHSLEPGGRPASIGVLGFTLRRAADLRAA